MVEYGLHRAKALDCDRVQTIPEQGTERFYERCGLSPHLQIGTYLLPPEPGGLPADWKRKASVPAQVVELFPMRLGWVQGCSKHMWEIANRGVRIAGSQVRHPCAGRSDDQGYVQLRYLGTENEAMALAWASGNIKLAELTRVARRLAQSLPVDSLSLTLLQREKAQLEPQAELVDEQTVWSVDL